MKYMLVLFLSVASFCASAQREVVATNEIRITGAVTKSRTFTINEIKKFQQVDLGDMSIKNHKGEEKYVVHNVKGVPVKSLLDSVTIDVTKPKELNECVVVFTASDGYKNVYSWNEIYNTEVGSKVYILTQKDGKDLPEMDERIQVVSLGDINQGMRRMRGLSSIEIKKMK